MDENQVMEAPETGTAPRPGWRGNRARIGILAAVLGVIAAFMCVAVIAPPTVQAASIEEAVLAGAVSGGVIGGAVGTVVPGLGTAVGGLIGIGIGASAAGIGYIIGNWGENSDDSAAALAKWLANDQRNQTISKMMLAETNARNVEELAQRAITYYERSAYYGSASLYENQTQSGAAHIYDSDYVLDKSHVSEEMIGSVAGSYAVYNKVFRQLDTVGAGYIGDYSGNTMRVATPHFSSSNTYDSQIFVRLTSYCSTGAGQYVYLNATDTVVIWNLATGTNSGTVTLTDADGVAQYSEVVTLPSRGGYTIDLASLDIESGRYNLALPSGNGWIWSANAAEDYSGSGTVAPGIAVYYVSAGSLQFSWGWAALPANQGFSTSGYWSFSAGRPWEKEAVYDNWANGGWPYLQFSYKSGTQTVGTELISLKPYIESIWDVSRSWRTITYAASLAGQTSYQVLLDNGGVGADGTSPDVLYPPTSIVMPDYDQLGNMTAQELLGIYYAYLSQLNETFQTHAIMDPSTINISTNSFDLLIRGKVWYNGTLVIDNSTPFSLYTMLEGLDLKKGQNSTLTSSGYIITWADGYSSLLDYINAKGNVANVNITYHDIGEGWTIYVEEMTFENKLVDEHALTVDKLETYVPPDLPDLNPLPQLGDADSPATWCLIGIMAGAVLVIVGIAMDNTTAALLGFAVAIVAAAAWYLIENPIDLGLWCLANVPESLKAWTEAH